MNENQNNDMKFSFITVLDGRKDWICKGSGGMIIPGTPEIGISLGIEFTPTGEPDMENSKWAAVRFDADASPAMLADALEHLASDIRSGNFASTGANIRVGHERDMRSNKEWPHTKLRDSGELKFATRENGEWVMPR